MPKVAIVTDTTSDLSPEIIDRYNIYVVPQVLVWDGQTYEDGVDIKTTEFYKRLESASVMPSTSQATPKTFTKLYSEISEKGEQALAILVSKKLSGTITSANLAKENYPNTRIEIFDSEAVSMALGLQVMAVARSAEQGASIEECLETAIKAKENCGLIFAVDTLEFLHRGGRIGGAAKLLGSAIKLKPILELKDGMITSLEKVRTRKKSLKRLVQLTVDKIGDRRPIYYSAIHANSANDAREVLEEVNKIAPGEESYITEIGPVVGTHAGPGTVGLAFLAGI